MNSQAIWTALVLGIYALVGEFSATVFQHQDMPLALRYIGRLLHLVAIFSVVAVVIILLFPSARLNP